MLSDFAPPTGSFLNVIASLTGIVPGMPATLVPVVIIPVFDITDVSFPSGPPDPAFQVGLGTQSHGSGALTGNFDNYPTAFATIDADGGLSYSGDVNGGVVSAVAGDLATWTTSFGVNSLGASDPVLLSGTVTVSFYAVAAVPEPGTLLLLAPVLSAIAARTLRKRCTR